MNLKTHILLLFFLLSAVYTQAENIIKESLRTLQSPNGDYEFCFYQKRIDSSRSQMYYTVTYQGKEVVSESQLGVLIDNKLLESALGIPRDESRFWIENLTFKGEKRKSVDDQWNPVYGERSLIIDRYNQLILYFEKGDETEVSTGGYDRRRKYEMDIVIRAYNEGVAFRYHFPETTNGLFLHITGEQTEFCFPEHTMAYHSSWAQGAYTLLPLEKWTEECERPLTLKLSNGLYVALLEAEMVNYARGKFRLSDAKRNTLQLSLYSSVDVISPYSTPWRVIMAANASKELIANNDIILNLNPENKIKDTSWITPGKVIRSELTQADAIRCIDFAAKRGLQYVHLDAGWYGPEMKMSSMATDVVESKDLNLKVLCAYARSQGVGLWLYVNQRALIQQLDELLPLYNEWGIKGIKFGFVQIGNQYWSTWLHEAVRKCAEHKILVDIHDEYRPTGFSRTYPNLLTQEGIHGNEEFPDATQNTILPFTRFLAGAGDYTICYYSKRLKNTKTHQLAMAAVYYSPLQFLYWYDRPSAYEGEPEIEFFDKVKTVWDDTKVIDGEIGEFVTIARRSGEEWFLGTMGNNDAHDISTPLSFLNPKEKYVANVYTDNEKAETKTKVRVTRLIVDNLMTLRFQLKKRGGCAIHFVPATKEDLKKHKAYKRNQIL